METKMGNAQEKLKFFHSMWKKRIWSQKNWTTKKL